MLVLLSALCEFQSVLFFRANVKDVDKLQQRPDATTNPRNILTLLALGATLSSKPTLKLAQFCATGTKPQQRVRTTPPILHFMKCVVRYAYSPIHNGCGVRALCF